jgi:hypothetical protein
MLSKISSMGLVVLIVLFVVFLSGCTLFDDVKETESDGVNHFEGKGISFSAPNTWHSGQVKNESSDYLFTIGRGTGQNIDFISFHKGYSNKTLSEQFSSYREGIINDNFTIYSEKELTVDGLPAYQITTLNVENIPLVTTGFIKNGILYTIYAIPSTGKNLTSIEPDLEMILNTFHAT